MGSTMIRSLTEVRAKRAHMAAMEQARAEMPFEEVQLDDLFEYEMCQKRHSCGHQCKGVSGESACLPCLNSECHLSQGALVRNQTLFNAGEDELCGICYTSELGSEACVRVQCGHVFHAGCLTQMLIRGYGTLKINFGYLDCPSCKQEFFLDYTVPVLTSILSKNLDFKVRIEDLSIAKAREEGLDKEGQVVTPGAHYYGRLREYAMHQCTFFECFKCNDVYYGGLQDCADAMGLEQSTNKESLKCKKCMNEQLGFGLNMCETHGNKFVEYKCKYCCSVAMFICCGANEYFCQPCHNDAMNGGKHNPKTDCTGGAQCPLGVFEHPRASRDVRISRFALGCSLCRSEKLQYIASREDGDGGFNVEQRADMKARFDRVLGHDQAREMRIQQGRPQKQPQLLIKADQ